MPEGTVGGLCGLCRACGEDGNFRAARWAAGGQCWGMDSGAFHHHCPLRLAPCPGLVSDPSPPTPGRRLSLPIAGVSFPLVSSPGSTHIVLSFVSSLFQLQLGVFPLFPLSPPSAESDICVLPCLVPHSFLPPLLFCSSCPLLGPRHLHTLLTIRVQRALRLANLSVRVLPPPPALTVLLTAPTPASLPTSCRLRHHPHFTKDECQVCTSHPFLTPVLSSTLPGLLGGRAVQGAACGMHSPWGSARL